MRQVIENRLNKYNVLDVDNDVTVLEFLKQRNLKSSFNLQHISKDCFDIMSKCDRMVYILDHKYVAGYSYQQSNSSGGLKISDDQKRIFGSFKIEEDRVIYSPISAFYEEKGASVYLDGDIYYTTMTMRDLLLEELKSDRELLFDLGKRLKDFAVVHEYEKLTLDEMLSYATCVDKGKDSFKKLMKKYY